MTVSYVEFLGQRHPLCFSLAASEKILEEFKSLENMSDAIAGYDLVKKGQAVDGGLKIGRKWGRIYLSGGGEDWPPEVPGRPAEGIDVRDPKARQAIFDGIRSDTERTGEAEGKNGEPASGQ